MNWRESKSHFDLRSCVVQQIEMKEYHCALVHNSKCEGCGVKGASLIGDNNGSICDDCGVDCGVYDRGGRPAYRGTAASFVEGSEGRHLVM